MVEILGRVEQLIHWETRPLRILLTGAAGTVGQALLDEIGHNGVTALDHDEESVFWAKRRYPDVAWKLGRVEDVSDVSGYDCVIHCAAYKHVGLLESCPRIAVQNNVGLTANLAGLCYFSGIHFVFVSTDKAVDAVGVMGRTKWVAERAVDAWRKLGLKTTILRFANVLNASGSVLQVWDRRTENEIKATGKHKRWFITKREAATGILRAVQETDHDNYLFAIKPDEETRIIDLARDYAGKMECQVKLVAPVPGERTTEKFCHDDQYLEKIEGFLYAVRKNPVRQPCKVLQAAGQYTVI